MMMTKEIAEMMIDKNHLETICNTPGLKKSRKMANALAKDLEEFTGVKTEALEGTVGRKSRSGQPGTPGHFIRTTVFDCGWEKFLKKEEAQEMRDLIGSSISASKSISRSTIKPMQQDFGILETLVILFQKKSKLTHTKEAYDQLITSIRYGL